MGVATVAEPQYYETKVIAQLFNVSVRRVQQLVQEGVLETIKTPSGRRFDLIPTIQRYIKYLQDKATGRDKVEKDLKAESDKLAAEARLKTAKADVAEMELKELSGELHRAEDVEAVMTDHILLLRSMILALPGRLAVDVTNAKTPAEAAETIRAECYTMLNQLAAYEYDPDEYRRRVRERKGWDERTDERTADQ